MKMHLFPLGKAGWTSALLLITFFSCSMAGKCALACTGPSCEIMPYPKVRLGSLDRIQSQVGDGSFYGFRAQSSENRFTTIAYIDIYGYLSLRMDKIDKDVPWARYLIQTKYADKDSDIILEEYFWMEIGDSCLNENRKPADSTLNFVDLWVTL
jgi:hypothetical protein